MHDEKPSVTSMKSLFLKTTHRGLGLRVLISLPGLYQHLGDGSVLAQRACGCFHISSTHHLSPWDPALRNASFSAAQGGKNALTISGCRLHFPLWPQGRAGAFRRHWHVERCLHNHYNLWSTSPCYPAEGQMGTACLPPTGAGPSKGMQTLSSIDVFKILLSLWTSMECVTLPTDCATFQPPSFYDITHFNYF